MDNPLRRLKPQLFGDYPRAFLKLFDEVTAPPDFDKEAFKATLWRAFEFGSNYHEGQKRLSGEPYFNHCIQVATTLATWKMDSVTIIAGLLHDSVEDTSATIEDLRKEFGQDIANLVDGVTKISGIQFSTRKDKQAGNFMKMLLSVAKDLRVIIIKFADRLHNMRTIKHLPKIKQHRIALETRDVYGPLAHRLGMASIKTKLDDLVFQTLDPDAFKLIDNKVRSTKRQREKFILDHIITPIKKELQSYQIDPIIFGRPKSYASIYGKMERRNKEFEEIYDLYAIRIIVEKVEQCYLALGIVHSLYNPVQERFKDFIATPKTNGYQSVHTTVIGHGGQMVEIQIRTHEMNDTAEIGVAAHWVYKEGRRKSAEIDINVKWLRELLEVLQDETADPKEFMDLLKIDLFSGEIFVFTPAGDLIQLPIDSTTVDFAFQVHTQVGLHCMGAKVNHKIVPLNTRLKSGDIVEIITGKNQVPNSGWQQFVVSSKARNAINKYLKNIRQEESIKLGKEIIDKTLRRLKMSDAKKEFLNAYEIFGFADTESLLVALGRGSLTVRDMIKKLRSHQDDLELNTEDKESNRFFDFARSKASGIVLDGIKNLMVNFGKCCNPIPGDKLIGYVTRGRGVTVHQSTCKSLPLISHETDRIMPVSWNVSRKDTFNVRLKIVGMDYKGLLKNISECIAGQNINITSVDSKVSGVIATTYFIVQLSNSRQLKRLINKLNKIKNVDFVERT